MNSFCATSASVMLPRAVTLSEQTTLKSCRQVWCRLQTFYSSDLRVRLCTYGSGRQTCSQYGACLSCATIHLGLVKRVPTIGFGNIIFSPQLHCHLISFCPTRSLYLLCYHNTLFLRMLSHAVAPSSRETDSSSGHYASSTTQHPHYQEREQYHVHHQHRQQFYYPESMVHCQCSKTFLHQLLIISHSMNLLRLNHRARGSKHQPIFLVNLGIHTLDPALVGTAIAVNTAIRSQTD